MVFDKTKYKGVNDFCQGEIAFPDCERVKAEEVVNKVLLVHDFVEKVDNKNNHSFIIVKCEFEEGDKSREVSFAISGVPLEKLRKVKEKSGLPCTAKLVWKKSMKTNYKYWDLE